MTVPLPDAAIDVVAEPRISPELIARTGYTNPWPMLRAAFVFFLVGVLALVLAVLVGGVAKAGALDWLAQAGPVLGWFGLGGAVGAGGVAAVKR